MSGEEAGIVANPSAVCCGGASMIGVFGVTDDLSASCDPPPLIGMLLMAMLSRETTGSHGLGSDGHMSLKTLGSGYPKTLFRSRIPSEEREG